MYSNFCILDECCPELARVGKAAEQYLHDDPDASMAKIGSFLERLTRILLEANDLVEQGSATGLDNRIRLLREKMLIDESTQRVMNRIRLKRNDSAHAAREFTPRECDSALEDVFELSKWFINIYVDPTFEAPPYYSSGMPAQTAQPVLSESLAETLQEEAQPQTVERPVKQVAKNVTLEERIEQTRIVSEKIFEFELKGKQKAVLDLPLSGHSVFSGVAGSGKSFCALKRAEQLVHEVRKKVLVLTYNRTLINNMKDMTRGRSTAVVLMTYHQFATEEMRKNGIGMTNAIIDEDKKKELVLKAIDAVSYTRNNAKILTRDQKFFLNEIAWIEDFGMMTREEYRTTERYGRQKERLTRIDRELVYDVFEKYVEMRSAAGFAFDWNDLAYHFDRMLGEKKMACDYCGIIVDEGQDFSRMMLRSLSTYVGAQVSLLVLGDMGQRIYGSHVSWKGLGLRINKVHTLDENMRNTVEIAHYANAIRAKLPLSAEDGLASLENERHGHLPYIRCFLDPAVERKKVLETVERWLSTGSVCLILSRPASRSAYMRSLVNWDPTYINKKSEFSTIRGLFVSNFQSVKGLEFDCVIMPECDEQCFSQCPDVLEIEDEEDRLAHITRLLYVAASRAKQRLLITCTGEISRILPTDEKLCEIRLNRDTELKGIDSSLASASMAN